MPFEGQQTAPNKKEQTNKQAINTGVSKRGANGTVGQRKTFNQPTGKLSTNNVGIKETLNPTIRKSATQATEAVKDQAEPFTYEQLQRVWKAYSLNAKRERKENLYSALVYAGEKMKVSSAYQITTVLKSNAQANKMEQEKTAFLGYIRSQLKNYSITLSYTIEVQKKTKIVDSKGIFEQLAEENTSLNKFRKLFNLNIDP